MAYEQVETILKHVCRFHEKLGSIYAELAIRTNIERSRMLLNSMSLHEQNRSNVLLDYLSDAQPATMHTWISSSVDSADLIRHLNPELSADAPVEELIHWGLNLNNELIKFYEELASRSEPDSVRELFSGFLEEEMQEERQLAQQSMRCMDL